ncbi:MAG: LytTR family DNA-binding domain-containing protein [Winogradskyella arenosi]
MQQQISCFIVEDDPQALAYASTILEAYDNINVIGNAKTIVEAASAIQLKQPDFIILDVFLEDGNAFEFLALFKTIDFKIIFTTSYSKFAIEAFKFSAIDYLLKPYEETALITAIDKVFKALSKTNYQRQLQALMHNVSEQTTSKKLVLKTAEAIHIVELKDILFAQSDNNYTSFLLKDESRILVSKPLKSFDEKLKNDHFFRVHQSFLINLNYISSYHKRREEVVLDGNHAIPVSQSRKKSLLDYIDALV